jgi:multidrug efflux pump subunit AcrA (membrane-fusion protein)
MGLKERIKKGKGNKVIPVFLIIIYLCLAQGSALCQDRSPRERIPVKVVEAKMEGPVPLVIAMGTVNYITKVDLGTELHGVLKSVPVEEGQYVKQGQIVAVLDQSLLEAELKKNETALELAKVQLKQLDSEIAKVRAKVETTGQFFDSQKKLFEIGAIIRSSLDDAELKYKTAKEELNSLEASSEGGETDAELKIQKAEAELESIKIRIEKSTIKAPISGVITKKYLSSFELVRDQYQLIVTLIDLDEVYAEVDVNEKDFPKIRVGAPVRVVVDAFPGKKFNGTVSRIDSTVNKDNRTFLVKIRLKNPGHQMRPGMFLRAEILFHQRKGGLMIPKECLVKGRDEKRRVFVITNEVAFLRDVQIGSERGDLVEILKGVKEGDRVVIEGYERLFDLATVRSTLVSEGRR